MRYHVALIVEENGETVIENSKKCTAGVYRVDVGDEVVFQSPASCGNRVDIRDICGRVVTSVSVVVKGCDPTSYCDVWQPTLPGPYILEVAGGESKNGPQTKKIGFSMDAFSSPCSTIVVNPTTSSSRVSSLRMLTVMPRRLGKIETWKSSLSQIANGYNALHFTPTQIPGPSHSAYSLANVEDVDPLLFNSASTTQFSDDRWRELKTLIDSLNMVSITDVVLNHASSSGSWACNQPSAAYSISTCPYLTAAADLDSRRASLNVSDFFKPGKDSNAALFDCMHSIRTILEKFNFSEYFQIDFQSSIALFGNSRSNSRDCTPYSTPRVVAAVIPGFGSEPSNVPPLDQAMSQVGTSRFTKIVIDLRKHCLDVASAWRELHAIETCLKQVAVECFYSALSACENTIRYERVQLGKIDGPLLPRYFSTLNNGDQALNNGWVMNWPAGVDFAAPGKHVVFMKRHVVAWGDCLKLRYPVPDAEVLGLEKGEPEVWRVMESYCRRIAATFHGVRLDNCHSTPIHVLRRLIRLMRQVNPNLLIVAELFTGEAGNDLVYEASLGIDLLVREAMQIGNVSDLIGMVWAVTNHSVGSSRQNVSGILLDHESCVLRPTAHSCILYDATHDNSTVFTKFGNFQDALPLAAVVACAPSAIGSSVGFDDLATSMPSVVVEPEDMIGTVEGLAQPGMDAIWLHGCLNEKSVSVCGDWDGWRVLIPLTRTDSGWELEAAAMASLKPQLIPGKTQFKFVIECSKTDTTEWVVDSHIGVTFAKLSAESRVLNNVYGTCGEFACLKASRLNPLHAIMDSEGFTHFNASSICDGKLLMFQRMNPVTRESYLWLIGFRSDIEVLHDVELELESDFDSIEFAVSLESLGSMNDEVMSFFLSRHDGVVCHWSLKQLGFWLENDRTIFFKNIPPGIVIVVQTRPVPILSNPCSSPLNEIVKGTDYSYILFNCGSEESCYVVPDGERLIFAGLAGVVTEIESTWDNQSRWLSSSLAANIRAGDWLFDYIAERLRDRFPSLHKWLRECVRPEFVSLPSGLKPGRFVEIFKFELYDAIMKKLDSHLGVPCSSSFHNALVRASFQFTTRDTVAAGLPHFSSGYMRCWGRDTFISFPGMFLCTKRWEEGRACLLSFAKVVRHGLIPNLYDDGNNPRYNSRDATWCFLHSVCCYIETTGDVRILEEKIELKFACTAFSYSSPSKCPHTVTFGSVVAGLLMSHWFGIEFVEWNAGPGIDSHMKKEGFNVHAFVDKETGVVYGGNAFNCGTWMDKMGSVEGRNRGIPATPRFGGAVEINGLVLRVLDFFVTRTDTHSFLTIDYNSPSRPASSGLNSQDLSRASSRCPSREGMHTLNSASLDNNTKTMAPRMYVDVVVTLTGWKGALESSFDCLFFNRERMWFNDVINGDIEAGFKLRPNACFALSVIPKSAVRKEHAESYLRICDQSLRGPLGMRTLPANDPDYNGTYDNSDDTCGFNYHNGPEWVWLFGHFIKACNKFEVFTKSELIQMCEAHEAHIKSSVWRSLPELTNGNGQHCQFSCPSQAWSICCILEAVSNLS